jgi:hypothetical protein
MKINLLLNNAGDIRSGYVNIDPFVPDGDNSRIKGEVFQLDHAVDAAEAQEIVAHDILDFAPAAAADTILDHWLSKLAHGGKLTVSVVDFKEVAKAVLSDSITVDEANRLIHGEQREPWEIRKASYTLGLLCAVLGNKGYKLLTKRIHDHRAVITCQRP